VSDSRVELVQRGWDAYNRGDIEGTVAILDPEIVVHSPVNMANAGTYHGIDGFLAWIGHWNEAWDSFSTRVVEVETVGERHVVTAMHQSGTGRGSGIEVTMRTGWVFEQRDGLCVYMAIHPNVELARADARRREAAQ
jgi:ketosteroid isomerase-like protein